MYLSFPKSPAYIPTQKHAHSCVIKIIIKKKDSCQNAALTRLTMKMAYFLCHEQRGAGISL